jgi:hypothetical protein
MEAATKFWFRLETSMTPPRRVIRQSMYVSDSVPSYNVCWKVLFKDIFRGYFIFLGHSSQHVSSICSSVSF